MSINRPGSRRGVIVVVDCHSHLQATIEAAIALASTRRLEVHGLYIEDPDLSVVASLPFSQEVTLLGAQPRIFESRRLNRSLQDFTRRFEHLLAEQAKQSSLVYSFSSRLGKKSPGELLQDSQPDYLVLGQPRPAQAPSRKELCILVMGDTNIADNPALESLLTHRGKRPVQLLLVNSRSNGIDEESERVLVARHPDVSIQHLPQWQLASILRGSHGQPDLVISSRELDAAILDQAVKLAACPVILTI